MSAEPAGRNLEVAAKHRARMIELHRLNPFVPIPDGSEKMPNVFLECPAAHACGGSRDGQHPEARSLEDQALVEQITVIHAESRYGNRFAAQDRLV